MPHRNRTLMMVVSLIWIVALLGSVLSAQMGSGSEKSGEEDGHSHSALILVEAPGALMANHLTDIDRTALEGAPA